MKITIMTDDSVEGKTKYVAITEEEYQEYQFLRAEREEKLRVLSNSQVDTKTGLEFSTIVALRDKRKPLKLAYWRRAREKSQAKLAQEVGISQAFYASIEQMKKRPTPDLAIRLAKALGVPVKSLIGDEIGTEDHTLGTPIQA